MAHPLSPDSSPLVAARGRGAHARSPSPPPQPQSKRDKRRGMLADKLSDMVASFADNKQAHYSAQLSAIQCDINLILRSDPYSEGPLDDSPVEIQRQVAEAREEITRHRPIVSEAENSFSSLAGQFYGKYVDDINRAVEERDEELTMVHSEYTEGLDELHHQSQFRIQLAKEEHALLCKSLRERLIQGVTQKKARLLKDKEQLDIADSNALLLNPTQFTIGNPASPGGPSANRKTRHTRLRPGEIDESAAAAVQEGNKRKRKAQYDDDSVSPGPSGRNGDAGGTSTPYRDAKAKLSYSQFEAPLYSIDRLFNEKELAMNMSRARKATHDHFRRLRTQGLEARANNATSNNGTGVRGSINGGSTDNVPDTIEMAAQTVAHHLGTDGLDMDVDDAFVAQPTSEMANQLSNTSAPTVHATRSTQRSNPLAELANTAIALPPYPVTAGKSVPAAPPLPGAAESDVNHDMALMKGRLNDEFHSQLVEFACEKQTGPLNAGGLTNGNAEMGGTADSLVSGGADSSTGPVLSAAALAIARGHSGLGTSAGASALSTIGAGGLGSGGVPMSKSSSLGGMSEAGGAAMRRSVSAADYGARSRGGRVG